MILPCCVFAREIIPIPGGDFKSGIETHWTFTAAGKANATTDDVPGQPEKKSIRVRDEDASGWTLLSKEPIPVKPGEHYIFSCRARVEAEKIGYTVELGVVGYRHGKPISGSIHRSTGGYGLNDGSDWFPMQVFVTIPENCDGVLLRSMGRKIESTVWLDDLRFEKHPGPDTTPKPKVRGHAGQRVRERLDRGLAALASGNKNVHLSWRLLETDPDHIAFNVYRQVNGRKPQRINTSPIVKTTDCVDSTLPKRSECSWYVVPVVDGKEGTPSRTVTSPETPYLSIPLEGIRSFQSVAIADLDGDGRPDYVVKSPKRNIDPNHLRWKKSPETYKLHAFNADGEKLWEFDMGRGIELGVWFSPLLAADLDGDGRAEIALKWADDHRDQDGKVRTGEEFLLILDGMTGKERARAAWPARETTCYSHLNRNQICLAYLDGKTPFVVALRGTYNIMQAEAFEFHADTLKKHWHWDNKFAPSSHWGQGAHTTHAVDLDGDGRDEIVLGSLVLDDNGEVLWSTGLGHPDHVYVGDFDPDRPGMEVYFGLEKSQPRNGICLVDAATGRLIWGVDYPTDHIHSKGMAADINAKTPGCEFYSGEDEDRTKSWLRDAKGNVLCTNCLPSLHPRVAWWDGGLQKSVLSASKNAVILSYPSMKEITPLVLEGEIIQIVDLFGDWREEIITSLPGELRIYSTTFPARDRRVTLLRDANYRATVYESSMGLPQDPVCSRNR